MARSTPDKSPSSTPAAAPAQEGTRKTLVMAGKAKDPPGLFVGYDGERSRFAGEKFWYYGEKLPSWCRVMVNGRWVDVADADRGRGPAAVRRAAANTAPGQAPKERIRQLVDDEALLTEGVDLPGAPERESPVSGRASDEQVG